MIRFLYGRPLETLLATWGISLILMQTRAHDFRRAERPGGESVVDVRRHRGRSPASCCPGAAIVIIGFAALRAGVDLAAAHAYAPRPVRARGDAEPRDGELHRRADAAAWICWAFGLGSGIAGLAGCALSQIGNVGPDLGQSYIVDSFMVVVLGGVGQLAGTVYAAMGLGIVNKFLEAWSGAVLAKIAVLVFIIVFIQKRPQGLFALKGRTVEA